MAYRVEYQFEGTEWKLHSDGWRSVDEALQSVSQDVAFLRYRVIQYKVVADLAIAEEGTSLSD